MKIKENEKFGKYLDFAKEFKMVCSMKVKVIPIVVCALGTVPKRLKRRNIRSEKESRSSKP